MASELRLIIPAPFSITRELFGMSCGSDSERCPNQSESDDCCEERRRIGRDLHDGTSQLLTLMQLKLAQLRRSNEPDTVAIIEECEDAIREIREQIRGIALGYR